MCGISSVGGITAGAMETTILNWGRYNGSRDTPDNTQKKRKGEKIVNKFVLNGSVVNIQNVPEGTLVLIASKWKKKKDVPQVLFRNGFGFEKGDFVSVEGKFELEDLDDGMNRQFLTGESAKKVEPRHKNKFYLTGRLKKCREDETMTKLWFVPDGEDIELRLVMYGQTDCHAGEHVKISGAIQTPKKRRNNENKTYRNLVAWHVIKCDAPPVDGPQQSAGKAGDRKTREKQTVGHRK